jgi:hypothetical protein
MEHLVGRHDQAVISGDPHLFREAGSFYEPTRHWLTATTPANRQRAAEIIAATGADELAFVTGATGPLPRTIGDFRRTAIERVSYLRPDVKLQIATYRRTS